MSEGILGPDSRPFLLDRGMTEYQGTEDGELVYRRDSVSEDLADSWDNAVRETEADITWQVDSDGGPDDDYVSVGVELWERVWNCYRTCTCKD